MQRVPVGGLNSGGTRPYNTSWDRVIVKVGATTTLAHVVAAVEAKHAQQVESVHLANEAGFPALLPSSDGGDGWKVNLWLPCCVLCYTSHARH